MERKLQPLTIIGCGMVSSIGLSAQSACAAFRCAIDGFRQTRFQDLSGKWITGASVPLERPWLGRSKLVRMAARAIEDCFEQPRLKETPLSSMPVLLCVAEPGRPGRCAGLEDRFLQDLRSELKVQLHSRSTIIAGGRAAGVLAMTLARQLIYNEGAPRCLIAGVDSMLDGRTLNAYQESRRLLTTANSNGFIPGEAAACICVGPLDRGAQSQFLCLGIGISEEPATIASELPLRGNGMAQAINAALADAGVTLEQTDYRIGDCNGEQYGFKEAALAMQRTLRHRKEHYYLWTPAACIGEVGAAIGPCTMAIALTASQKGYAPGPGVLCHFSNDDGQRAALILRRHDERVG